MPESRQYVRMSTVFPVEVEFFNDAGEKSSAPLLQGFTRNVSLGGMCIELKSFSPETEKLLQRPNARLGLTINPAFSVHPIRAVAKIAWIKKEAGLSRVLYLIGVLYLEIDPRARNRIVRYAHELRWTPRIAAAAGIAMTLVLMLLFVHNEKLTSQNRALVARLVEGAEKKSGVVSEIYTRDLKEVMRHMVDWLKSHQNVHTGLIASFEGDAALEDTAFTYDQSLACQTFLLFGDTKRAGMILSFYKTRALRDESGGFFNAYSTLNGQPAENIVHTGPNLWLGIAALQYEHRVKNGAYRELAQSIADWAIGLADAEGGLKGGPKLTWYSTEHNLDAYAFFSMLYQETGAEKYRAAADKVLDWIRKYAYSQKEQRILRGKGDATIATDTFSWSIAAIGPPTLKKMGFDPEQIMEFAQRHCEVTVPYTQPNGRVAAARGFDFAKARNLGRGGVISTEWTAQMIAAYDILAGYFDSQGNRLKAEFYRDKAVFYMNELQKLVITSPSRTGQGRGCLPYASADNVDTGHGWRTPRGSRTGSVSATAYGLFAWMGYNPFYLTDQRMGNRNFGRDDF